MRRNLVYCFVNKGGNSRYIYRFFFSPRTLSLPLLGLGEAGKSVSLCGFSCGKHNPTVPEGIQSPLALSPKVLTLLFYHCTPTGQPGTRCDTECMASVGAEDMYLASTYLELDPCKQIPLPYFPFAPNSVMCGCLAPCYPLSFQTDILEFCHLIPRIFLSLSLRSPRFWENNHILEPGHHALHKQAISS